LRNWCLEINHDNYFLIMGMFKKSFENLSVPLL
jgi:hypothetical protein